MDPEHPLSAAITKGTLRRIMLERLRGMTDAERAEASLVICREAAVLPEFRVSKCVGLFASLATEPDLHPLMEEAWAEGKRVALPRMVKEGERDVRLEWHEVKNWDDLIVPGPIGLREPDPAQCRTVTLGELDLVFVPGLAYGSNGERLGRGGGFYDRFLSIAPAKLTAIGLMFARQFSLVVPSEAHDQPLKSVLTEDGLQVF